MNRLFKSISRHLQGENDSLFVKLIEQGKQEGFIDPEISIEAALFYIQVFKEALARPGFITQASPTMLRDIDRLFYYGLIGKRSTLGQRVAIELMT